MVEEDRVNVDRVAAPLRIVFLGSDPIALPALEWLANEGRDVGTCVGVFTQPDRAVGRGQKTTPNAIKQWALSRGLPVLQPEKVADAARESLAEFQPDLSLVMAYGHILRDDFIAVPRLGTINLHASLLPRYRGASPIQTSIANGERETGISLMRIVRALDAGPVAETAAVEIAPFDTAVEVEEKLSRICVPLLAATLPKLRDRTLAFQEQDVAEATYCRRLAKEDGVLDFTAPASVLAARIRGLFPWPGCAVEMGGQKIKIGLAEALPAGGGDKGDSLAMPGDVLGLDERGLCVATGEGVLRLLKLQRPGGRMLAAGEFFRGFQDMTGIRLSSAPMPPLVAKQAFPHRGKS